MPSPGLEAGSQPRRAGFETGGYRVPSLYNLGRGLVFAGNGTKGVGYSNKVDRVSGALALVPCCTGARHHEMTSDDLQRFLVRQRGKIRLNVITS